MDPCRQFLQNPSINPFTGLPLRENSSEFDRLMDNCAPSSPREYPEILPQLPPTIMPTLPTVQMGPLPEPGRQQDLLLDLGEYIPQREPYLDDFAITASPKNSEFIQAAIATGREAYPNFDFYLQLGLKMWEFLPESVRPLLHRANYPFFLKDASAFEIFKVYRGLAIEKARRLHNNILNILRGPMGPEEDEEMREFIEGNGFQRMYLELIRPEFAARYTELTPSRFLAAITPDQSILMEAWRQIVLTSIHPSAFYTADLLDLQTMREQLQQSRKTDSENFEDNIGYIPTFYSRGYLDSPKHYIFGFKASALKEVIQNINDQIAIQRGQTAGTNSLTVNSIRYQGEAAIDSEGHDRRAELIPLHSGLPREFYMMLYNEMVRRGIIID